MIELNLQQGTEAWHAARAKCFTASEAPAMKGVSPYTTRTELLRQKSTGIIPEVDAQTQRLFDSGHETEAKARPLVEAIIGKTLAPLVATDDSGKFLASSDGVTVSDDFVTLLCDIGFEHKLWNEKVAAEVAKGFVPEPNRWQLDQQFLVFGFEKIIFVCSNGTPEKFVYCWYYPDAERIASLRAGWDQFEQDLAEYQHVEAKPATVADAIENLPALTVQLVGQVTASNLESLSAAVKARIKAINTDLQTDTDFVNADKMVKFLSDGEKSLDLVKEQALAQTSSIDQLFRNIDILKEEMRGKRLALDKLVKAEKENRKNEIVTAARADLLHYIAGLNKHIGVSVIEGNGLIFAEAIRGLKSLDSMRDKVSAALASAKVEAKTTANRVDANRKIMEQLCDPSLFPDFATVCTKAPDDFAALIAMRVSQQKEADDRRLAAEREKIRAEEEARARREAAENPAKEMFEAMGVKVIDVTCAQANAGQHAAFNRQQGEAEAAAVREALLPKDDGKTIRLGDICARLGFTMTGDFLATLGFTPVAHDKNAKLYRACDFSPICFALCRHISAAQGVESGATHRVKIAA